MLKRLTAATLLLSAVAFSSRIYADILEQVRVKVNGEIITKTEFEARQVAAWTGEALFLVVSSMARATRSKSSGLLKTR